MVVARTKSVEDGKGISSSGVGSFSSVLNRVSALFSDFAEKTSGLSRFSIPATVLLCVTAIFIFALLALAITNCFFNYNGLFEGYTLYTLINASEPTALFLSTYYLILHLVGAAFGHLLVGYRFVALASILGASAALGATTAWYIKDRDNKSGATIVLLLTILNAFFYYTHILTIFSYYTMTTASLYLWCAGNIWYFGRRERSKWTFPPTALLVFATFLAFTGRPVTGVLLVVATPVLLYLFCKLLGLEIKKSDCGVYFLGAVSTITAHCAWYFEVISCFPSLYKAEMCANHGGVLGMYLNDAVVIAENCGYLLAFIVVTGAIISVFKRYFCEYKMVAATAIYAYFALISAKIYLFITRNSIFTDALFFKNDYAFCRFYFVVCLTMIVISVFLWLDIDWTNALRSAGKKTMRSHSVAVWLAMSFYTALFTICAYVFADIKNNNLKSLFIRKRVFILCVSLFSAFLSAFGTAGALSRVMVYSMSALILSVIVFLFDYTHGFSKKNSSALLFVLFSGSIIGSFMYNFHTLNNRKECFYSGSESRYSPYLKYIKIEKKQRDTIDSLILKLNEFGFDKKKDRIFSSYIPGIVAASGARSFGTPFQLYLPNSLHCHDVFTCAFLDLESKKNIRHVYLLLSNEQKVGDKAWTHLFMMIRDCGKRKTSIVGEGPIDVMSESGAMLTLAGPYEFNKNFVPNQEITFHIEHNLERENR